MHVSTDRSEPPTAIRTYLGAIFASLEPIIVKLVPGSSPRLLVRGQEVSGERHDHRLARGFAPTGRGGLEPLGEITVLLEAQKAPGQLDLRHRTPALPACASPFLAAAFTTPSGDPVRPA